VPDVKDEVDFVMKYRAKPSARDPLADLAPVSIPKRPVDVWVVSNEAVHTTGNFLEGLPVVSTKSVSDAELAGALGETKSWGFDPKSKRPWVITHMYESLEQRVAFEDLRFEAASKSPATPGTAIPLPNDEEPKSPRRGVAVFVAVALALVAAAAAIASERKAIL
jgi:hypothetical protein